MTISAAAAALLLLAPLGDAATGTGQTAVYRGGGTGIQVEFRVRDHQIVRARLFATLRCTGTRRGNAFRHTRTLKENATAGGAVPVRRDGSFREGSLDEYGFYGEEFPGVNRVSGRLGPERLVGRYAVHFVDEVVEAEPPNRQTCQTGEFPPERMKELSFRARRVR